METFLLIFVLTWMDSIKYQDRMFLSNTHNNDFALHVKTYSIYSILFKMYTALGTDELS